MTATLAQIWRHPVKGIGAEALDRVTLSSGRPLPLDRTWAVLEAGRAPGLGWQVCTNFIRGAKGPSLMAVTCRVEGGLLHLAHPDRPDLALDPDAPDASDRLVDWVTPIYPPDRPAPARLVPAPPEGMSDAPFASVSILNEASRTALSEACGADLDPRRFRGNLWLDGLAPFGEFALVGRTLHLGDVALEVVEPITRCCATEANPETGLRDAPTLRLLQDHFGHTDFGVYARVVSGGEIARGDGVLVA